MGTDDLNPFDAMLLGDRDAAWREFTQVEKLAEGAVLPPSRATEYTSNPEIAAELTLQTLHGIAKIAYEEELVSLFEEFTGIDKTAASRPMTNEIRRPLGAEGARSIAEDATDWLRDVMGTDIFKIAFDQSVSKIASNLEFEEDFEKRASDEGWIPHHLAMAVYEPEVWDLQKEALVRQLLGGAQKLFSQGRGAMGAATTGLGKKVTGWGAGAPRPAPDAIFKSVRGLGPARPKAGPAPDAIFKSVKGLGAARPETNVLQDAGGLLQGLGSTQQRAAAKGITRGEARITAANKAKAARQSAKQSAKAARQSAKTEQAALAAANKGTKPRPAAAPTAGAQKIPAAWADEAAARAAKSGAAPAGVPRAAAPPPSQAPVGGTVADAAAVAAKTEAAQPGRVRGVLENVRTRMGEANPLAAYMGRRAGRKGTTGASVTEGGTGFMAGGRRRQQAEQYVEQLRQEAAGKGERALAQFNKDVADSKGAMGYVEGIIRSGVKPSIGSAGVRTMAGPAAGAAPIGGPARAGTKPPAAANEPPPKGGDKGKTEGGAPPGEQGGAPPGEQGGALGGLSDWYSGLTPGGRMAANIGGGLGGAKILDLGE